jgi:hypothetical protein
MHVRPCIASYAAPQSAAMPHNCSIRLCRRNRLGPQPHRLPRNRANVTGRGTSYWRMRLSAVGRDAGKATDMIGFLECWQPEEEGCPQAVGCIPCRRRDGRGLR